MQSAAGPPGDADLDSDSDMSVDDASDPPSDIPDFVRAWESLPQVVTVIRRPSIPPDPEVYHTDIDPQAIFELDEAQKDGSIETILVVPPFCTQCRSSRKACSRARPACARCKKSGDNCKSFHEAYDTLPGPKCSKGGAKKTYATVTDASRSRTQESISAQARVTRQASRAGSLPASRQHPPQVEAEIVTTGSKRPLSPEQAPVRSRKKTQTNATSRKGTERCQTEEPSTNAIGSGALTWTLIDPLGEQDVPDAQLNTTRSFTLTPRVWTNSLAGILNVFPELDNTLTGLSWLQFETPLLLLEETSVNDQWTSSTALCINMSWNFSCYGSDLEVTEPVMTPQHISHPLATEVHCEDGYLGNVTYDSPTFETRTMMTFTTNEGSTPTARDVNGPRDWQPVFANGPSPLHAVGNVSSSISDAQDAFLNNAVPDRGYSAESTASQADPYAYIPLVKPSEIETLIDSHTRHIPLLIWMSRDCRLAPSTPSAEYAYLCMGFFFISDLRHTVIDHTICPNSGVIRGQVFWSIKFEWAPGGEEALFEADMGTSSRSVEQRDSDTRRDLSRPWWINSTETSEEESSTPYRPRDLRMQFTTFLPLDLLADFHPTECFPRGWFCNACGLINIQKYFRHQICQSSTCRSASSDTTPEGKAEPLSNFRDLYQSQILLHPTDKTPLVLKCSEKAMWTDGMQSYTYGVKDKVTLCHVFTGNQESLQTDANVMLETIQCEALLRREDPSSPYFIHTTKLLHAADGSGTTVPVGTPSCVRTAYYTLRDVVERYGEMEKPALGEVHIRAWTTSGSKRGHTFDAKTSPVVILCLGAEVILNFIPKGGYNEAAQPTAADLQEEHPEHEARSGSPSREQSAGEPQHPSQDGDAEPSSAISTEAMAIEMLEAAETPNDPVPLANTELHPSTGTGTHTKDDVAISPSDAELKPKRGRQKKAKQKKVSYPEISMTLVHGDSVILFGDDFECQIVRVGTTILIVGS